MRKVELLPTRDCEAGYGPARKSRLCTDVLRDTRCSRALNTQLPCVTAERDIHLGLVMYWQNFGSGVARAFPRPPGRPK